MASGYGHRFGGNKLLATFGGKPLLQWVLESTAGLFRRRVVVTRYPEVADLCRRMQVEVEVVLHELPNRNDTIRLGLEALGDEPDYCMFCPGDQPLLSRTSLERMILAAEGSAILRLSFRGKPGSPVLFPRDCFQELRSLPDKKGGRELLKRYPERVQLLEAESALEMLDVDCPEDLEQLMQRL